jgi:hypothetical protein
MKLWMRAEENTYLTMNTEYYDVSDCELFNKIIETDIIGIELIVLEGYEDPFGIKILFKNDYIISLPNSDGNTVETKSFNRNNSIENFKHLGKIIYLKI